MPNKHRSQYLEPSRLHSPILMRIMKGQFRKVAVCSTPTAFDVIPFHFVGKPEKEVQSLRLEVGCPLAHMLNLQEDQVVSLCSHRSLSATYFLTAKK